jgi:hypothetical protein
MWGVPKRRLYKKPKSRKMMEVGSESRSRIVDEEDDEEEEEGEDDVLVMVRMMTMVVVEEEEGVKMADRGLGR